MKSNFHGCPDCKCKGPISRKEVAAKAAAARWGKRTAQLEDTEPCMGYTPLVTKSGAEVGGVRPCKHGMMGPHTAIKKEVKELAEEPKKDWENEE